MALRITRADEPCVIVRVTRPIPIHCDSCGAMFTPGRRNWANGRGRFCSKPCKGVWQSNVYRITGHMQKHGMTASPTWKSWDAMKQRILNSRCKDYPNYGGRGLDMDPRWLAFEAFLRDMGERPSGMTLGRVDNERGYWPDNCRWEDWFQQGSNRRSTVTLTVDGQTRTLAQWARHIGASRQAIRHRYRAGWKPEDIVSIPFSKSNRWMNYGS